MRKKIMLLGSGELGKEFVIAAQRLGQFVIAVDSYEGAPAMQVAHEWEVVNMLDGNALDRIVEKHKPDIIVPEIEAIRTDRLYDFEDRGIRIVPSARAVNFTMNRKAIRDLAAKELGIKTAAYRYATSETELSEAIKEIGLPCVIKPLMSSSGKGQSYIRHEHEISQGWQQAVTKGRGDLGEVIVEAFIPFESEITLLTVTQDNGPVLFCPPIGHRQERGDYMESWQPAAVNPVQLIKAQQMAAAITTNLTGSGIWGVEFFLTSDDVYFSELSPRPHDTGMVTLAGTQEFNEFELHVRAVLGLLIPGISLVRSGASAVILAGDENNKYPVLTGLEQACSIAGTDIRIFGKPVTRKYRRMGVALAYGNPGSPPEALRSKAAEVAGMIKINEQKEVAGIP